MKKTEKSKTNFWIIGIIVVVILGAFYYFSNQSNPSSQISSSNNTSIENPIDTAKQSIVWVKYVAEGKDEQGNYFPDMGGTGSGIILSQNESLLEVLTNRHVVDCGFVDTPCFQRINESVSVRTQDGKIHQVTRVLYAPHEMDVALLEANSDGSQYTPVITNAVFEIGDKVTAVGYPAFTERLTEFSVTEGSITNVRELLTQDGFSFKAIDSDVYTYFGSSGGGLFNKNGELIGVTSWISKSYNLTIATSIEVINNFSSYDYCDKGSYAFEGRCFNYCPADKFRDKNGTCIESCGGSYCSEGAVCCNNRCAICQNGLVLGDDCMCHEPCGSSGEYCSDGAICYNNRCAKCQSGLIFGNDGMCHEPCGSSNEYCSEGAVCCNNRCAKCQSGLILGNDCMCHEPCGSSTTYCSEGSICFNGQCVHCPSGTALHTDGRCY